MSTKTCCVCHRSEKSVHIKRCGNLDTCTGCKKSHYQFFEKMYPKLFAIPDFEKELKLGENGSVFQKFWHDSLFTIRSCLRKQDLTDFKKLCEVTYDGLEHPEKQICTKCRTRKICLRANPPETKATKFSDLTRKKYECFYKNWPEHSDRKLKKTVK